MTASHRVLCPNCAQKVSTRSGIFESLSSRVDGWPAELVRCAGAGAAIRG